MEVTALLQVILSQGGLAGGEPRSAEYTGTKALMLAVLEDGIRTYLGPAGTARTEAEWWVHGRPVRSPFAFPVVCETLGLEPNAVRRALVTSQDRLLQRPRHRVDARMPQLRARAATSKGKPASTSAVSKMRNR